MKLCSHSLPDDANAWMAKGIVSCFMSRNDDSDIVTRVTFGAECLLFPTENERSSSFPVCALLLQVSQVSLGEPASWLWCTRAADCLCQCRTACNHLWWFGRSRFRHCQTGRRAECWGKPCERHRPLRCSGCCSSSGLSPRRQTWSPGCFSQGSWPPLAAGLWLQPPLDCWCLDPRAQTPPAP